MLAEGASGRGIPYPLVVVKTAKSRAQKGVLVLTPSTLQKDSFRVCKQRETLIRYWQEINSGDMYNHPIGQFVNVY